MCVKYMYVPMCGCVGAVKGTGERCSANERVSGIRGRERGREGVHKGSGGDEYSCAERWGDAQTTKQPTPAHASGPNDRRDRGLYLDGRDSKISLLRKERHLRLS